MELSDPLVFRFAELFKDVREWVKDNAEALEDAPPTDQQLADLSRFAVRGISLFKQVI